MLPRSTTCVLAACPAPGCVATAELLETYIARDGARMARLKCVAAPSHHSVIHASRVSLDNAGEPAL